MIGHHDREEQNDHRDQIRLPGIAIGFDLPAHVSSRFIVIWEQNLNADR
jgi:hypothetical protein